MIEIKRSCNSSIRDDLEKRQIIFGAFTIKITEADYTAFNWMKFLLRLNPIEMLLLAINVGIDSMKEEYAYPEVEE